MGREFELRKRVTLNAAPEQVWKAIATGPGVDSWFMGRNEIEPREGGAAVQRLGDVTAPATVTAYEPPERFALRSGEQADGSFMAVEYLVEGRGQGGTVLRLVQSGVLGDDWEAEYDGLSRGWDMYLHTLGQYLTHFPGRTASTVFAARALTSGADAAAGWARLERSLGLTGPVAAGERVRLTPDGPAPVEGVADYVAPGHLGVRTGGGFYRFNQGVQGVLVVGHHLFGDDDPRHTEATWRKWLDGLAV
jgi:uncharacterized protein YndB with AHSA1/START domain